MFLHRGEDARPWQCEGRIGVDADRYRHHPFHAPLDHALAIDFLCHGDARSERVAIELSADSARALVRSILSALESGEAAHAPTEDADHMHV